MTANEILERYEKLAIEGWEKVYTSPSNLLVLQGNVQIELLSEILKRLEEWRNDELV